MSGTDRFYNFEDWLWQLSLGFQASVKFSQFRLVWQLSMQQQVGRFLKG